MKKFLLGMCLAIGLLFATTPKANALPIFYTGPCVDGWANVYQLQNVGPGFEWVIVGVQGCALN